MIKCLICGKEFESKRQLGGHLINHNISAREYKEKFNLIPKCKNCGKELSKHTKGEYCDECRDRTGKNNSFFGKKHTDKTKEIIKQKNKEISALHWQDQEYREKVIAGTSKPRSEEGKKNISKAVKEWYDNNPGEKEIRSEYMKQNWKDGIIVTNNFSCNKSKYEDELESLIRIMNPNIIIDRNKPIKDTENKWYFPDILLKQYNIIIEFFGDYWHANPIFYNKDYIFKNKKTAEEIWEHDFQRIYKLENNCNVKYKVFVIWQNDFINNKEIELKKLKDIICNLY